MNSSKSWLIIAGIAIAAYLLYLLQPILMPFLVGGALAYFGDPAADRLERLGLNRTLAASMVFVVLALALLLIILLLVPLLARQLEELYQRLPDWLRWLEEQALPWLAATIGVDLGTLQLRDLQAQLSAHWSAAGGIARLVIAKTTSSGLALLTLLANLALIPVVAFYLLRDWDLILAKVDTVLPRRYAPTIAMLARECDLVLSAFVRGQLLVMLALGAIYAIGLWLTGLKLALLIGMIAGLASIVPYLGFAIGIIAASAAAFFQFQEWQMLVPVWLVFGIGQVLESTVLTPYLVGDRIGLHPVAVIFAVLACGQLFGFTGILLALPVAAVIMVLLRHAHDRYRLSTLYSGE
ncbi:MAG TPA: AI-2E family transporter [Gammaproteobacteria bacterium]|nr:AI-2E family transporter [Gammaproteobacteria bacterium]